MSFLCGEFRFFGCGVGFSKTQTFPFPFIGTTFSEPRHEPHRMLQKVYKQLTVGDLCNQAFFRSQGLQVGVLCFIIEDTKPSPLRSVSYSSQCTGSSVNLSESRYFLPAPMTEPARRPPNYRQGDHGIHKPFLQPSEKTETPWLSLPSGLQTVVL